MNIRQTTLITNTGAALAAFPTEAFARAGLTVLQAQGFQDADFVTTADRDAALPDGTLRFYELPAPILTLTAAGATRAWQLSGSPDLVLYLMDSHHKDAYDPACPHPAVR